jgi:hydrogenase maturation factor
MCLGEVATVVELLDDGRARARFADGTLRDVSLAVLVVEGVTVGPGDTVAVSIGMALHLVDREEITQ